MTVQEFSKFESHPTLIGTVVIWKGGWVGRGWRVRWRVRWQIPSCMIARSSWSPWT